MTTDNATTDTAGSLALCTASDMTALGQRGDRHLFASALETHGFFDEATERCSGTRGELDQIRTLGHDVTACVSA